MIKRPVLYIILCSLWFTACVSDDNFYESTLHEIAFQPVVHSTQTRAGGTTYPTNAVPFGGYAWFGPNDQYINTESYINDAEVHYSNSAWRFNTTQPYYWPPEGTLDFFCYSPYANAPKPTLNVDYQLNLNSLSYNNVVVSRDQGNDHIDLMYSNKAINEKRDASTTVAPVAILFNHALAKVRFNIVAPTLEYTSGKTTYTCTISLSKLTLTNIRTNGSITLSLNEDKKTWNKPSPQAVWNTGTIKENRALVNGKPSININTEATVIEAGCVIPQVLLDGMKLKMTYKITRNSKTKEYKPSIELNSIKSGSTPITAWEMNKVITYNILINPAENQDPLFFIPNVDNWTDQGAPDINIAPGA